MCEFMTSGQPAVMNGIVIITKIVPLILVQNETVEVLNDCGWGSTVKCGMNLKESFPQCF